jgi:hypothetical protein
LLSICLDIASHLALGTACSPRLFYCFGMRISVNVLMFKEMKFDLTSRGVFGFVPRKVTAMGSVCWARNCAKITRGWRGFPGAIGTETAWSRAFDGDDHCIQAGATALSGPAFESLVTMRKEHT